MKYCDSAYFGGITQTIWTQSSSACNTIITPMFSTHLKLKQCKHRTQELKKHLESKISTTVSFSRKSVMGKERLWAIGQAAQGSPLNCEGGIPQRRDAKPAHRTLLCRQEGKSAGERVGKRMFPD